MESCGEYRARRGGKSKAIPARARNANAAESEPILKPSSHILITAGPTHEPIDTVRYLANRSSGRMGLALAQAAREAGHRVTLLLGPVPVEPPPGIDVHRFETTADLERLLAFWFPTCDALIMAAAVADYRPVVRSPEKIPRREGRLVIELEATPDLVACCAAARKPHQRIVAFALEAPEMLPQAALEKLKRKRVDAIVANPLATIGSDTVAATLLTTRGPLSPPTGPAGPMDKRAFARWLIRWLAEQS